MLSQIPLALLPAFLFGCSPADDSGAADTADTSDTADSGDSADTSDSGDTSDTSDTANEGVWNVLVYMSADNNLDSYTIHDLNELEETGSSDTVNVLVQVDRNAQVHGDDDWTGARRYRMVHDETDAVVSPMLEDLGEVDSGDPATVVDFLAWAAATYPAGHTVISFWDHGDGWQMTGENPAPPSFSYDDTSGTLLSVAEGDLHEALVDFTDAHGKIDVVAFDACNMAAWEVAYTLRDHADFLVASEATVGWNGLQYAPALAWLEGTTAPEARDLAIKMASDAVAEGGEWSFSATDLTAFGDVARAIDRLAERVGTDEDRQRHMLAYRNEAAAADRTWHDWYIDLYDLSREVAEGGDPRLQPRGEAIRDAMDAAVTPFHAEEFSSLMGLTTFFATDDPASIALYQSAEWSQAISWGKMLAGMAR